MLAASNNENVRLRESKKLKGITYLSRFVTECMFHTFFSSKMLFSYSVVRLFNIYIPFTFLNRQTT